LYERQHLFRIADANVILKFNYTNVFYKKNFTKT
jgi:hypothetical protein